MECLALEKLSWPRHKVSPWQNCPRNECFESRFRLLPVRRLQPSCEWSLTSVHLSSCVFLYILTAEVGSELIQKYLGEGPKLVPLCFVFHFRNDGVCSPVCGIGTTHLDFHRCEKCSAWHKNMHRQSFSLTRSMQLPQRGSVAEVVLEHSTGADRKKGCFVLQV